MGGKGKKGAKGATSAPASTHDEAVCVSVATQPRHYEYVAKIPADALTAGAGWTKGDGKAAIGVDGCKGKSKGKVAASKGSGKLASGGTAAATGAAAIKGDGKAAKGSSGGAAKGSGKDTQGNGGGEDTKGSGKGAKGNSGGKDAKGVNGGKDAKGSGKGAGAKGAKGITGAEDAQGSGEDAKGDHGGKAAKGSAGGKDAKGSGKDAKGKSGGKAAKGVAGGKDAKDSGNDAKGAGGGKNAKGSGGKDAKGHSAKGSGKDAKGHSTKGSGKDAKGTGGGKDAKGCGGKDAKGHSGGKDAKGGGGKGSSGGKDASKDPDPCTPPPKSPAASLSTGTPPSQPSSTRSPDVEKPTGKGSKGVQEIAPITKGNHSKGKGKSPAAATFEQPSGKGKRKPTGEPEGHQVCRRVSFGGGHLGPGKPILRSDTGISTMSDGTGPVEMEPLSIPESDGVRPLTDEERAQIEVPCYIDYNHWFAFLKAFLLDRDHLATIEVQPYYEELSENKEKETFEELPLVMIKQKYGKKHPQSDLPDWRIYKVFKNILTSSANVSRVGSKTTATKGVSGNKAERTAVAEVLEGKASEMGKMMTQSANSSKGNGKNRNGKGQKGKKELTAEEVEAKGFQKDLQAIRDLSDKSISVAAGLAHCGLENQESLITQLGRISTDCGRIRDEIQGMVIAAKPLSECIEAMNAVKADPLKDYQRQVLDAEGIYQGKAAEKRKREKAEKEKKEKENKEGQENDEEYAEEQETWGDENEEHWPEESYEEAPAKRARS
ncbi:unnamed protein product [Symbiodinium sp. CCMP2592]|nr:unnamed protein product [Symbiodinium sp. CCMP2592]